MSFKPIYIYSSFFTRQNQTACPGVSFVIEFLISFFFLFYYFIVIIALLVVEQTNVLLHKGDAQLLGRLEHGNVVLAAEGSGNVLDARSGGAVDIVGEGELFSLLLVAAF